MNKAKITAFIHAKNEERALPQVIRNIQGVMDEIIVLDGMSSDRTRQIARQMGARVILRRKEHAEHVSEEANNYYAAFARNNWIFHIDCDELLSPELKFVLPSLVKDPRYRGYRFRRRNYVSPGVWCRRCFYPNYQMRLWDRRATTFPKEVHVEATVRGEVKDVQCDMLHLTYIRSRERAAQQHSEYSKAEPEKLSNPFTFAASFAAVFAYFFFFKLGILEPACWKFLLVRTDYYARHSHHSKSWLSRVMEKIKGKNKGWNP